MAKPDRPRRHPSGGRLCDAAVSVGGRELTSSSFIWRSTNATGLRADFITTTPAVTRWCRSTCRTPQLDALLTEAQLSMDAPAPPQIVITIAARFGRVSWKYSSLAYALILKDVGVLIQTLYLMATDMGLGGCAIGSTNIDLFAKMTGIEFHVEGPVGQFALGRGKRNRRLPADRVCPTRTIAGRARRTHRRRARARNIRPGGFSVFPPARIRRPAGPRIGRPSFRPLFQSDLPGFLRRRP